MNITEKIDKYLNEAKKKEKLASGLVTDIIMSVKLMI